MYAVSYSALRMLMMRPKFCFFDSSSRMAKIIKVHSNMLLEIPFVAKPQAGVIEKYIDATCL